MRISGIKPSLPLEKTSVMQENTLTPSCNKHISTKMLSSLLVDELSQFKQRIGESVALKPLGKLKEGEDATTKLAVLTPSGQPTAVIICSRPVAPELMARGTELAETIRDTIGQPLGEAIIQPISSGYAQGRSYVVLPYCPDFSPNKLMNLGQRLRIRRPLLDWLQQATASAADVHGVNEATTQAYLSALEHLEREKLFDKPIQIALQRAIERLTSGQWQPRHTFDHNDLWLGNVMLTAKKDLSPRSRYPFTLIDWAGANPKGYGIYDLIRISREMKLSKGGLHKELVAHSEALGCDLEDTRGHLLAALGHLHRHREHFPEARFVATAQRCWEIFNWALPMQQ